MNLRNQITQSCAVIFFLFAILWQPIHQLEHLSDSHEEFVGEKTSFSENLSHCSLCDYVFYPTLEIISQKLETPLEFNFSFPKQESRYFNHYNSKPQSHKQLRAPPFA